MMKYNSILLFLLLAVTTGCTETETVITDLYPSQQQFVKLYADSLGVNLTKELLPEGSNAQLTVKGFSIYGDEFYCTNFISKRVEIFDSKTLQYKGTIIDEESNMESMDVYADDKYIYVSGKENPRSQVSVYDRQTKAYVCRLGNGYWWSGLVHSLSIASSDKYIFVRDKSDVIRVFLKSEIGPGKSLNTYCHLYNDKVYIYDNTAYNDMMVMDSTLYAVNIQNKMIYTYNTNVDYERNVTADYQSRFNYADNQVPQAIASNAQYLFVATKNGSTARINIYQRDSTEIALEKPNFVISSLSGTPISDIHAIATKGDTLFLNTNEKQVTTTLLKKRFFDKITETPQ